ncbi:hypothetical protein C1708_00830 [Streptomyces sp. DH-12]|nr:hypothetical protein [Streptomyces sp. DH-12]PNV31060.1 hypothetical protein C1708_00830 [Streptomyces sp. DH-12]
MALIAPGDVLLIARTVFPRRPGSVLVPKDELVRFARITHVEAAERGTDVRLRQLHRGECRKVPDTAQLGSGCDREHRILCTLTEG